MGKSHTSGERHRAAAVHHQQAVGHHREASRHYETGKDYAHAAHQAYLAHGHAALAIDGVRGMHADHEARDEDKGHGDHRAVATGQPAAAGRAALGPQTCAQHHAAAAVHHEQAQSYHDEAAHQCDQKNVAEAAHVAGLAHDHAQRAVFHGAEAAKHHVEHHGRAGPTAEIM